MKIKNFYGNDSEEVKYEKEFESWCIALAPHTNKNVKDCTVREYFALMKFVNDKAKKKK